MAVDTNVLVAAHREEMPKHEIARRRLRELAEGPDPWALPVFVVGEFVRVVTHGRIFDPPTPLEEATTNLDNLVASPSLRLLHPSDRYWQLLREALAEADARGNLAFDAQIAAVCREHGAETLLTEDRDFRRFTGLDARPLN